MSHIADIHARSVLDGAGRPTAEVTVQLSSGVLGRARIPSTASTARRAAELLSGEVAAALRGRRSSDQDGVDRTVCALESRSELSANATLGVSLACARASAADVGLPLWQYLRPDGQAPLLPMPLLAAIDGAARPATGETYMLVPVGAQSLSEALQMSTETDLALHDELRRWGPPILDGGGDITHRPRSSHEMLDALLLAIERAGYEPGRHVAIAVESAPVRTAGDQRGANGASAERTVDHWLHLLDRYPIVSLEDPLPEDDVAGWTALTARARGRVQLVGDAIFVAHPGLLRDGVDEGIGTAILVELSRMPTLSAALELIDLADAAGYRTVISQGSAGDDDTAVVDLAVASGVGQLKMGAAARSDCLTTWDRLLEVEQEMSPGAEFASMIDLGRGFGGERAG